MEIPLVDLKAQYLSIQPEVDEAIHNVLARSDFIQGEEVKLLEREFAEYCGAREAIGVSSGTEALRLALLACGVGEGDEVITTPFTFIATTEAIIHIGARPVFVDIDPVTCNISPDLLEAAITPRTKAVIPVHLYGMPADMDRIMEVARRYGLAVIEDAAQAHGAMYKGRRTGSLADMACFSFYPAKNLGAYGDGGMVVTSDRTKADAVRMLRDHGRKSKYEHLVVGYNSRLDTLQAAILRVKLRRLDRWNARRRAIAAMYRELLENVNVVLPHEDAATEPGYYMFVIRTERRDHLSGVLSAAGIGTGIHYPIPLHLQPALRHLGYGRGDFPQSERAAREVLSLPMYPELFAKQVARVARVVGEVLALPDRIGLGVS